MEDYIYQCEKYIIKLNKYIENSSFHLLPQILFHITKFIFMVHPNEKYWRYFCAVLRMLCEINLNLYFLFNIWIN